jgi:lipooligosaccharide transport system ATP-binding protein
VLELFDARALQGKLDHALKNEVRIDGSQHVTLMFSSNLDYLKTFAGSLERGNYLLRETNLEDLFLKATGRGLNESQ